ncbi:MAG: Unknown protein [uncultured Thiotrichaceae bacterium]|uniref:Uncharacterized protein n=1 Tax=uncultured Thiotrichaceae bacterium TaxID=298394 RepID=A0A6S6T2Z9_9GAMM|nr:MAG: Unknown protein [uncultured Thiotrichaceae bacterium]
MTSLNSDKVVRCKHCSKLVLHQKERLLKPVEPESWNDVLEAKYLEMSEGDVLCPYCMVAQNANDRHCLVRLDQPWKLKVWAGIPAFMSIKLPSKSKTPDKPTWENRISIYWSGASGDRPSS